MRRHDVPRPWSNAFCLSERPESTGAVAVPDPDVEEVRVAMALNGGVSLAVWMGGCAVELDCARRAHWGPEDLAFDPIMGGGPTRTVYHSLCAAFRRELVIDIMSGASAGGINGGLLAASMVRQRRLHPSYVRKQWLSLGEFAKLLHRSTTAAPRSLMQGKRFSEELFRVFEEIAAPTSIAASEGLALPASHAEHATQSIPRLDVTVTDVTGSERSFRDAWGGTLSGREYRRRFRFREESDFTSRNLAAAARCSASFPAAFEPFQVEQDIWTLTAPPGTDPSTVAPPWTIDGGLLDNAPIRAAIELIPTRAASRQVKRFLVYVNPEPDGPLEPSASGLGTNGDGETPSAEPQLADVLGYVVNLPRKTPLVDQLEAIEDAVQKSSLISDGVLPLLASPIETVVDAAEAMLAPYASRRRLSSLRDLLGDSAAAARAYEALRDARVELPWIPRSVEFDQPPRWDWGLSAAIRFCHFLLDLIRLGIAGNYERREIFLAARVRLDQHLGELQAAYAGALDNRELMSELRSPESLLSTEKRVAGLRGFAGDHQSLALSTARRSIRVFADLLNALGGELTLRFRRHRDGEEVALDVGVALLGERWQEDAAFHRALDTPPTESGDVGLSKAERHCLRRALSIEVIRRAFSAEEPVDSAQELSFVQLTPDAPASIFSFEPFTTPFPASAESKLTGIRLGHFGGFLKRSWRANDFMWGRLDAAARIVDLLVDPARAIAVGGSEQVAQDLAASLLPDDATLEARWLITEALGDWPGSGVPASNDKGKDEALEPSYLRPLLQAALTRDLADASSANGVGPKQPLAQRALFTRTVCTRAAQLEIVSAELPAIEQAVKEDAAQGSLTPSPGFGEADRRTEELPTGGALKNAIWNVRRGSLLPHRLGRDDPAETTSDLTARTAAQAGFVTLAALRTANLPGARGLDLLRPPLLAVSGMSATGRWVRIPLVLGYWAAGMYLAARAVDTAPVPPAELASVLSKPVLLALVAALAVLGVAILPLVRGVHRRWSPASFAEFGAALLLIVAGGGAAIGLALGFGDELSPAQLIIAPGFDAPPEEVVGIALLLVLGLSLARSPLLRRLPGGVLELTKRGAVSAALLAVVAVLISIWTLPVLFGAIADGPAWKTIAASVTLVLPPVVCVGYLVFRDAIESSVSGATSAAGLRADTEARGTG